MFVCPLTTYASFPQLNLAEVPKEPTEGYEHDETFLRKMHHVLLEVRILGHRLPRPPTEATGA